MARSELRLIRPAKLLLVFCVAFTAMAGFCVISSAQATRSTARATPAHPVRADVHSFPVLFVSDIHFDPFHDPGKAKQLDSSPVSDWQNILSSAPSADQQQAFEALQKQCGAKGVDTPITLLESSLAAMKARQPDARFIVASGDLVVHDFPCRYRALFPQSTPADYEAFVLKTISYVSGQLRHTYPGMPVYTALGNNDSGCADYRIDPGSEFLAKAGATISLGVPGAVQQSVAEQFAAEGNYSILLPVPMKNTRLIVLNDTFLSPKYKTCSDARDGKGAEDGIGWLRQQLADARKQGQRVWVVGHIPPGVDPYATAEKFKDVCGGDEPTMFLSDSALPDLLVEYADVVKLGVFAHTHMDEVRLLTSSAAGNNSSPGVAIKMVPSISPVHGNRPSFTVATINADSAGIQDYTVIAASNETGDDAKWAPEYSFSRTYRQAEFSPAALKTLIDKFRSDNVAILPESESYLRNYYAGDRAAQLSPFWSQYVCALSNYTGKGFAACVCRTGQ